ncbi:hypothetical protein L843_2395 [Mycobacterium intracellulare MIN_061107_1834]|nr:hypothetical protein L843_2395 [Mycobacterium intracellulare MIN_061107_1834]
MPKPRLANPSVLNPSLTFGKEYKVIPLFSLLQDDFRIGH